MLTFSQRERNRHPYRSGESGRLDVQQGSDAQQTDEQVVTGGEAAQDRTEPKPVDAIRS